MAFSACNKTSRVVGNLRYSDLQLLPWRPQVQGKQVGAQLPAYPSGSPPGGLSWTPRLAGVPGGPKRLWGFDFDTREEAEYQFSLCRTYARALKFALDELNQRSLPAVPSLRPSWVRAELQLSTKRLAENKVGAAVAGALCKLLSKMSPGGELDHLRGLLRCADHRGSVIRVSLAAGEDGDLEYPYPAFAWRWQSILSYPWEHTQHINILEFISFFNYLRSLSNKVHLQHLRSFHVLDSRVCCGVIGKGRSPSRRMNRCCRRLLPLLLGMDWYLLMMWTVSDWMYSDAASRLWSP